jgi:hypothetical protein
LPTQREERLRESKGGRQYYYFRLPSWRIVAKMRDIFFPFFQLPERMQLHTGAAHFGNVIFRYSELTSQYHIDASIDDDCTRRRRDKTIVSQSGTVAERNTFKSKP